MLFKSLTSAYDIEKRSVSKDLKLTVLWLCFMILNKLWMVWVCIYCSVTMQRELKRMPLFILSWFLLKEMSWHFWIHFTGIFRGVIMLIHETCFLFRYFVYYLLILVSFSYIIITSFIYILRKIRSHVSLVVCSKLLLHFIAGIFWKKMLITVVVWYRHLRN